MLNRGIFPIVDAVSIGISPSPLPDEPPYFFVRFRVFYGREKEASPPPSTPRLFDVVYSVAATAKIYETGKKRSEGSSSSNGNGSEVMQFRMQKNSCMVVLRALGPAATR